jgi:hypothetical protein
MRLRAISDQPLNLDTSHVHAVAFKRVGYRNTDLLSDNLFLVFSFTVFRGSDNESKARLKLILYLYIQIQMLSFFVVKGPAAETTDAPQP